MSLLFPVVSSATLWRRYYVAEATVVAMMDNTKVTRYLSREANLLYRVDR
jgi:hypothetical protein